MKSPTFAVVFLSLAPPLLTGCIADSNAESPLPTVDFSVIANGNDLIDGQYGNKKLELFTDQTSLSAALYSYIQPLTAPSVDFTANSAVLLSLGARPTGGYSISAQAIEDQGDDNKLKVLITKPGDNCLTTQAFTSPYQFIEVNSKKTCCLKKESKFLIAHKRPTSRLSWSIIGIASYEPHRG